MFAFDIARQDRGRLGKPNAIQFGRVCKRFTEIDQCGNPAGLDQLGVEIPMRLEPFGAGLRLVIHLALGSHKAVVNGGQFGFPGQAAAFDRKCQRQSFDMAPDLGKITELGLVQP